MRREGKDVLATSVVLTRAAHFNQRFLQLNDENAIRWRHHRSKPINQISRIAYYNVVESFPMEGIKTC